MNVDFKTKDKGGKAATVETEFVKKLIEVIKEVTGLDFDQYTDKSRQRDRFYARMIFAYNLHRNWRRMDDIAKILNRNRSMAYYYIEKYIDEVKYNKEFRELAERVEEKLR